MKRRTSAVRMSSFLLLVVLVAVQPQVLCGLHCMLFAGSVPVGAASGHPTHRDPGTLCSGHAITGGRTIPAARLAAQWLPADPSVVLSASLHTLAPLDPAPPGPSVRLDPERPPPWG